MSFVVEWVRNVFIMVAAMSFVEILLPSGSMGKYLKFILSLMILAVVLYPLSELTGGGEWLSGLSQNLSESEEVERTAGTSDDGSVAAGQPVPVDQEEIAAMQTRQIKEVYQSKLEESLKEALISQFPGIRTAQIHIYINDEVTKRSYGDIGSVTITVEPGVDRGAVLRFTADTLRISKGKVKVEETNAKGVGETNEGEAQE